MDGEMFKRVRSKATEEKTNSPSVTTKLNFTFRLHNIASACHLCSHWRGRRSNARRALCLYHRIRFFSPCCIYSDVALGKINMWAFESTNDQAEGVLNFQEKCIFKMCFLSHTSPIHWFTFQGFCICCGVCMFSVSVAFLSGSSHSPTRNKNN